MNASAGVANGIGQPVRRKEDFRLLTGGGCYVDDLALPGMAHAVMVRSPHAHARIVSFDKAAALAAPGVLAVLTAADMKAAGLATAGKHPPLPGRGGKALVFVDPHSEMQARGGTSSNAPGSRLFETSASNPPGCNTRSISRSAASASNQVAGGVTSPRKTPSGMSPLAFMQGMSAAHARQRRSPATSS